MGLPGENRAAFTLIELLVTMAILGVMATIVVIQFTGVQGSGRDAKRKSELKQFQNAIEVFGNTNDTLYPARNGQVDADSLCGNPLLATDCPVDPLDGTAGYGYFYRSNGTAGINDATAYVLYTRLERPNPVEYFVLCSTGRSGTTTTVPNSSACPAGLN